MLNGAKKSKEFLITVKEIMNKPNQEMKKEIYFPKGAKSINFDLEQGIATAIYEEEKPALEVGEWRHCPTSGEDALILDEKGYHVGIRNGKWINRDENVTINIRSSAWKLSDMQEVKKLLIKEAEKRGFDYITYCIIDSRFIGTDGPDRLDVLFSFKTGKWAEIVEKKPLYINQYGTEFFEGDEYYFVLKETYEIDYSECLESETTGLQGDKYSSEIMTRRECHLWIADKLK